MWQCINIAKPKDRMALSSYNEMMKVWWYSVDAWCWRPARSVPWLEPWRWSLQGEERTAPGGEQGSVSLRRDQEIPLCACRAPSSVRMMMEIFVSSLQCQSFSWAFSLRIWVPKVWKTRKYKERKKNHRSHIVHSWLLLVFWYCLPCWFFILFCIFLDRILYCVC